MNYVSLLVGSSLDNSVINTLFRWFVVINCHQKCGPRKTNHGNISIPTTKNKPRGEKIFQLPRLVYGLQSFAGVFTEPLSIYKTFLKANAWKLFYY